MSIPNRVRSGTLSLCFTGFLAACAPGDDVVDQTVEPIAGSACVLTTYDGYNIFRRTCSDGTYFNTSDGNTANSAGVRTGLEWQCVEWTNRYFHFKWGTPMPWYGNATDKCATHPSSVSTVSTPWAGDIVVFRPGACLSVSSSGGCLVFADATYGHIGIVTSLPSATTMLVKDQNGPQNTVNRYNRAAVGSRPNPVQCFLRASHHVCEAGTTQSCTASGCTGTQTCATTGLAWGACATSCADAGSEPVPDGGADAGIGGGADGALDASREAGATDASGEAGETDVARRDVTTRVDGSSDAGDAPGDAVRRDVSPDAGGEGANSMPGCGCAVAGRGSSGRGANLALALGVASVLVRRRARRRGSRLHK
jgi:surface antigen